MQQKENPSREWNSMWSSKDEREKLQQSCMWNVLWQRMKKGKKKEKKSTKSLETKAFPLDGVRHQWVLQLAGEKLFPITLI